MIRRSLVAAALAAVVASVVPAAAVPTADQVQYAQASLSFYSKRDGATYLVDVEARLSRVGVSVGTGGVRVAIRRCGGVRCTRPTTYTAAITQRNFSVQADLSSGFLNLPLFGKPLALTWRGPVGQVLPGYELDQATPRVGGRVFQMHHVRGIVAGRPCESKEGVLAQEVRLDAAPRPAARALPSRPPRALAGLLTGTCASIVTTGP